MSDRSYLGSCYTFSTQTIQPGKELFFSIELLRGLASILILLVHYKHFFSGPPGQMNLGWEAYISTSYYEMFGPLLKQGSNAVQLFWVISGFVFLHVYGGQAKISGKHYTVHRFSRLYPLHFLTLILIALMQIYNQNLLGGYAIYQNNDLYHFTLNIFFASEWGLQEGRSFNGPIWSVSAEILSYIVFFLLIHITIYRS